MSRTGRAGVRGSVRKMGPTGQKLRPWTDFEVDLVTHPGRPSDKVLAGWLGRTEGAIVQKRFAVTHASAA